MIAPGVNVVCTRSVLCQLCGESQAARGALYMCEEIICGGISHLIVCRTEGCDNQVLFLHGKDCAYCACCFKPLNDGDTSLVEADDMRRLEEWERKLEPERVS